MTKPGSPAKGTRLKLSVTTPTSSFETVGVVGVVYERAFSVSYKLPNGIGTSQNFYSSTWVQAKDRLKGRSFVILGVADDD